MTWIIAARVILVFLFVYRSIAFAIHQSRSGGRTWSVTLSAVIAIAFFLFMLWLACGMPLTGGDS